MSFTVATYGDNEAFRLAREFRANKEKEVGITVRKRPRMESSLVATAGSIDIEDYGDAGLDILAPPPKKARLDDYSKQI